MTPSELLTTAPVQQSWTSGVVGFAFGIDGGERAAGEASGGVLLYVGGRDSATPAIDPEVKKMWRIAGFTGAVGLEIAAAIAIGFLGGQWLDRKFETTPIITIIGFLAGIGAAIKALVRVTRSYKRTLDQQELPTGQETPKAPGDDRPGSSANPRF